MSLYDSYWIEVYKQLILSGVDPDQAEVDATDMTDDYINQEKETV